jgi:hypothetical protein
MRKIAFVLLGALALAATAAAQTKTSGTVTCKPDPVTPVAVGDQPGHSFAVAKAQCTWSKFEIAGLESKEGLSVSFDEIKGDKTTSNGYHTATLTNGDKTVVHFQGTATTKDGKFLSGGGTFTYKSGTGKVKGIKGHGTYKGTPNADGTVTYKVDGAYSLP